MAIYTEFFHEKWWCSHQFFVCLPGRVSHWIPQLVGPHLIGHLAFPLHLGFPLGGLRYDPHDQRHRHAEMDESQRVAPLRCLFRWSTLGVCG